MSNPYRKEKKKLQSCSLCARREVTPLHYEDPWIWVVDCLSCHVPMVVLKRHTPSPTHMEREYMRAKARNLFPKREWDETMNSIPDHFHAHMR